MIQSFKNLTHLLRRITEKIQHDPDRLQELLGISVHEIRRILDVDCVQIYRDEIHGNSQSVVKSDRREGFLSAPLEPKLPPLDRPLKEIDTFPKDDRLSKISSRHGVIEPHSSLGRSVRAVRKSVSFPIRLSGAKWGDLKIDGDRSQDFSFFERQLLQLLVDHLAIGIEKYQLRQEIRQHTQRDQTLESIDNLLQSTRDDPRNLQWVLQETIASLGCIGGRLYLHNEVTSDRSPQLYVWGEQPTAPQLESHPSWQAWLSMLKTCQLSAKPMDEPVRQSDLISLCHHAPFPVIVADFHPDAVPQPLTPVVASTSIHSILTISLDYGDRCVGYLSLFRSRKDSQKQRVNPRRTQPPQGAATPQDSLTPSWSAADIRFVQSASLHLYLSLLCGQVQCALDYQASHDGLTRLPNRKQFELRLERALRRTRSGHEGPAVAVLDLNGFKRVNYTLGHPAGDRVLIEVTQRLQRQLPPSAGLARWGDDRFTFLLEYISSVEEVSHIAQTVLNAFSHPFHLDDREIYITASLGVTIAPTDGDRAIILLKNAEIAMHQAKRSDNNSYQFYTSQMNRLALTQLVLEADLRKASARDEFWLDYQPQIELTTGQIVGMEALIRWQHPTLGAMPPDRFIGLAEETGLICPIGEWVMRTACLQQRSWVRDGVSPVRVAVNLSVRQLQPDLVSSVAKILHDTQMNPRDLELEITESVAVQNLEMTIGILQEFQAMGITIALDDFGTGYSCLSAVEQLPLDVIKIDRSLVVGATQNQRAAAIAKTVLALGRGLNLLVLAEGVETPEQLEFLKSIHCDLVQGNFFSSPLRGDRALEFLRNGSVFMGIEKVKLTQL